MARGGGEAEGRTREVAMRSNYSDMFCYNISTINTKCYYKREYFISNRPYKCRVAYKSTLGVFVHRHQVMRVEQLIVHSRVRRELAPGQAIHVSKNDVLSTCK